jgi:hypothetical protein
MKPGEDKTVTHLSEVKKSRAEQLEQGWQGRLEDHVKEFNINHAVVMVGGKTRIMRKTSKEFDIDDREGFEYLSPFEMESLYSNTIIQTGLITYQNGNIKPVYANHFKAWFTHQNSDVYRNGVLFRPKGGAPEGVFNTWQGFGVTELKTCDWERIRGHIDGVVCDHNAELIDYFYNWIAFTFQHPEKPVRSALVLRGKKGSGKGIIGHFLRKLWGRHGLYITQAEQITGKFNGHLADICFLFADEAFFSGDKKHQSTLKGLVTDPVMMIERKGLEAVQQPNYLKLFMVTNEDWAVPSSADERRWGVFDVSDAMTKHSKYFKDLNHSIKDKKVQASFLADMMARDVSQWRPNEIPESCGLMDQRVHSLDSMGEWLMNSLKLGNWDGFSFTFKELYTDFLSYCVKRNMKQQHIKTATALGRFLARFFEKRRIGGDQSYIFESNDQAIRRFEEIEKVVIDD